MYLNTPIPEAAKISQEMSRDNFTTPYKKRQVLNITFLDELQHTLKEYSLALKNILIAYGTRQAKIYIVKTECVIFTSSEPLSDDAAFCCCCCFLSTADLCTASMLGLDFQN